MQNMPQSVITVSFSFRLQVLQVLHLPTAACISCQRKSHCKFRVDHKDDRIGYRTFPLLTPRSVNVLDFLKQFLRSFVPM